MKTISREELIAQLSQGEHPQQAAAMVKDVLAELGWAGKESFAKDDIPPILLRVAENTQRFLQGQADPHLQDLAQGLGQMLDPIKHMTGGPGAR